MRRAAELLPDHHAARRRPCSVRCAPRGRGQEQKNKRKSPHAGDKTAPAAPCPTVFGCEACPLGGVCSPPVRANEEESRILQPHRKSGFDAQVRARVSRFIAIFGEGANADGAREWTRPAPISFDTPTICRTTSRSPSRWKQSRDCVCLRLRDYGRQSRSGKNEGPLARFDPAGRARPASHPHRLRSGGLRFETARDGIGADEEFGMRAGAGLSAGRWPSARETSLQSCRP